MKLLSISLSSISWRELEYFSFTDSYDVPSLVLFRKGILAPDIQ